jgi:hypothetical protein
LKIDQVGKFGMHFQSFLLAITGAAILFPATIAQTNASTAPAISSTAKPLAKCPRHYSKHRDDLGAAWCMDSSGRSYTPENAKVVAKASKKSGAQY